MIRNGTEDPHTLTILETTEELGSELKKGLASAEAGHRLAALGPNRLAAEKPVSPLQILLRNCSNIIVYLLAAAGAAAFIMGDVVEGEAVIIAILIAIVSGFVTEFKAQQSVRSLQNLIRTHAKVRRDGVLREVDSAEIVPGDLIFLEEGDSVTADARIVESSGLSVIEASLTGESEAVDKEPDITFQRDIPLGDRRNMVYAGTAVARGNGYAVVTATGLHTEVGRISTLIAEQKQEKSPLEQQLNRLGTSLMIFAGVVAVVVTLFGILAGQPVYEMITIGIILAIAAIPEALPAVSTITLAIGMRTMAARNALVKSLPAVETLGSTTVICTDKTGTLTENQMTVKKIILPGMVEYEVTGSGYAPEGDILARTDGNKEALNELLTAGTLASNATIMEQEGLYDVIGDPTEGGIVAVAMKGGLERSDLEANGYHRLGELPFNSADKFMATLYDTPSGNTLFVKGAPDILLEKSAAAPAEAAAWKEKNRELSESGMRVIAVGRISDCPGESDEQALRGLLSNSQGRPLELLGLFGITDPPRKDVAQAVAVAREAGIRVIMITGDHPGTALSIAAQIGISGSGSVLTGREMDRLSASQLAERIRETSIFARVSPENKLQIVRALNIAEEVTAMTGDGVNDAPALKGADIGVAMGIRGTEVAKEAADMILTDDRFSTIVRAVEEGRAIFDNIQKFVFYLFSCNVVEIVLIFLAIALDLPLPVLALQILWLNLVVDVLPAMSLAWEPGEEGIMQRRPRDPGRGIVTRRFMLDILISGAMIGLGALGGFWYALSQGYGEIPARTISFSILAVGQLFHIFNVRRAGSFGLDRSLLQNPVMLVALASSLLLQAAAVYLPGLQRVLTTASLNPRHLLVVLTGSVLPMLLIQLLWKTRKPKEG